MPVYDWSQTAATNASSDSTVNWAEGQAPSTVNDSARAVMAAVAMWRDDFAGSITTGGSATAYTVATSSVFNSLVHMNGQLVSFVPHASNTSSTSTTLAVDGLTAKPIRLAPSVEIPAAFLTLGAVYVVTYNNTDGAFYLINRGGAIGYGKGSGAVVTQGTSRATAVTINALCGEITLFASVINAGSDDLINVNNSFVSSSDFILLETSNSSAVNFYSFHPDSISNGSFKFYIVNAESIPSASESPVVRFAIIKSAIS